MRSCIPNEERLTAVAMADAVLAGMEAVCGDALERCHAAHDLDLARIWMRAMNDITRLRCARLHAAGTQAGKPAGQASVPTIGVVHGG